MEPLNEEIVAAAMALGQVGETDRERLEMLCAAAVGELEGRLRDGVTREDCGEAFPRAAAWIALEDLGTGGRVDGVESFTAGGLTIRRGGQGGGGQLRRRGLELMKPYLKDEGFFFLGVPG